jgi:hypothetical protein
VSAISATVAATASLATWWRGRTGVEWELQRPSGGGRSKLINKGKQTARDVHVIVGSLSDPARQKEEAQRDEMPGGASVMILVSPGVNEDDYGVKVTWRGRFRRRKTHEIPVL